MARTAFITKTRAPYVIVLSANPGVRELYYRHEVLDIMTGEDCDRAVIADTADKTKAIERWQSLPSRSQ